VWHFQEHVVSAVNSLVLLKFLLTLESSFMCQGRMWSIHKSFHVMWHSATFTSMCGQQFMYKIQGIVFIGYAYIYKAYALICFCISSEAKLSKFKAYTFWRPLVQKYWSLNHTKERHKLHVTCQPQTCHIQTVPVIKLRAIRWIASCVMGHLE